MAKNVNIYTREITGQAEDNEVVFWKQMTDEETDRAIQEGLEAIEQGRVTPAKEVFRRLREKYEI